MEMLLALFLSCLLPLASASTSRACIDDSDCVDLGHKFACFLYKCYNWDEPSPEHPNCRYDRDCKNIRGGVKHECYRHWNLRAVNKGVCFSSYSLSPCYKHSDCVGQDSCCGTHCCPENYFQQWKNFTCLSDQQCNTWMTGDKCCDNMRCCHKDEDLFKEEDYEYYDEVEEEEVTQKVEEVEEIEDDDIKTAEDVVETTENNPGNSSEEVNEIIGENGDGIVVTTEHEDDNDDDDNEIHVLTEEDSGESKENVTESSDQDEDDKSEEGEQLFNESDYDYYDKADYYDGSKKYLEIEGTNDTSNATESAEHDFNQGQVVESGTEKQNEDIIVESTTNMEEDAVTEIPDDTTGGYKVVIMLEQEKKVEEDGTLDEEIYEDHHDNEEASKESSGVLDNNTVWKEEITEAISTEDELKPEETTLVENEEVFSSTAAPTIIEGGINEDGNENIEFVPIQTKELETNQEISIPEEESEKINTQKISLTIKPKTKTTRKPKYHEYQTKMSGSSTIFKPIMGQIMGILYVIKYLLIF